LRTFTKKGWWSGSKCRPWVQAPVPQTKEKKDSNLQNFASCFERTQNYWPNFYFSLWDLESPTEFRMGLWISIL
jgi:hypothetical protein